VNDTSEALLWAGEDAIPPGSYGQRAITLAQVWAGGPGAPPPLVFRVQGVADRDNWDGPVPVAVMCTSSAAAQGAPRDGQRVVEAWVGTTVGITLWNRSVGRVWGLCAGTGRG
jgi:hypothetical protein